MINVKSSGVFRIGGDLAVHRLGFGAMRITGKGIWGPPADREGATDRVDEGFANAAKIDALLHSAKVIQDWAPESSEQASGEETSDEPEAPAKEAEEPK